MGLLNVIYNCVRPISRNIQESSAITSLILGKNIDQLESIPERQESPMLSYYLDAPLLTTTDTSIKKALAVAAAIAKKRGVDAIKAETPMDLAAAVDDSMTRVKSAYQVGKGILNTTASAEEIIDRAASRLVAFTDKVIDKGLPIVTEKIIKIVTKVCPPAAVIVPFIRAVMPMMGNFVKKAIKTGIQIAATVAKSVVKSIKKGFKKIKNFLFG